MRVSTVAGMARVLMVGFGAGYAAEMLAKLAGEGHEAITTDSGAALNTARAWRPDMIVIDDPGVTGNRVAQARPADDR